MAAAGNATPPLTVEGAPPIVITPCAPAVRLIGAAVGLWADHPAGPIWTLAARAGSWMELEVDHGRHCGPGQDQPAPRLSENMDPGRMPRPCGYLCRSGAICSILCNLDTEISGAPGQAFPAVWERRTEREKRSGSTPRARAERPAGCGTHLLASADAKALPTRRS